MASPLIAPFSVDLTGHAAIVTGAGDGVGKAVALALAAAGAAVLVNDLNPDRADKIADEITASGGRAVAWQADVANRFQVGSMIETARDNFGRITILVNAAGVIKAEPIEKIDEWDWRRVVDVNLTGAFFCTQLLGRVMADEGGGVIVNIGSIAGHGETIPEGVSYVSTKAALIGLTQQAARELAPRGIRVNAICPGNLTEDSTASALAPALDRPGTIDEAAAVVLFLCSDASRYVTGQAINVDGGGAMA